MTTAISDAIGQLPWRRRGMSKRAKVGISVGAGVALVLVGTAAGVATYLHRARQAIGAAREAFDPYYAIVEYLVSSNPSGERMEPET